MWDELGIFQTAGNVSTLHNKIPNMLTCIILSLAKH